MSDAAEAETEGHPERWQRDAWDIEPDSINLALRSLSPRTTGVIIREAFYGTRRFDDFERHCGISPSVLSARLRDLLADGILEKTRYRAPGTRGRDEYRLTDKGRALLPIVIALNEWAEQWIVPAGSATISLLHHDCGSPVRTVVTCASGHEITTPGQVIARPGPGAQPASD
ncbi:winged helix-turn-helix transcriptional regulator [Streptomyces acidiscabies]|uniref:Helix-turn-helix domain-containing protein n=1 Tax=Streptomyces acidiscabies TaxID=42234 RepID=A0AAP6BL11_9ACTN|nr:helix-turn-helix domain-containing protein [Streptomyces acidiscabies]MBP5942526.1 helix-turn-helix transcriptional regulator [Streptomyces sp. LBUM 1476]MBZ3917719.1 helix-turn-helix transcriptional regulator [Streptomyces acidiscabies]MDX2966661.1 helix-turn-helix domain-containing protein [Streptomyces acidiscabies]MDX3025155.1 helix-turn-helix domain-containing protein [Streptomyces acidiscabies]MDX3796631.1 helix-turn-helix domain-containing protein [Streptomyces acidiscabies]